MKKILTLEVLVDENISEDNARQYVAEVVQDAQYHYLCLDGSVAIRVADVELEESQPQQIYTELVNLSNRFFEQNCKYTSCDKCPFGKAVAEDGDGCDVDICDVLSKITNL